MVIPGLKGRGVFKNFKLGNMFHVPNKWRVINHPQLGSDDSYGNNGFFIIPHPKIKNYFFQVQASDGMGWEHVSVSLINREPRIKISMVKRCPTWEEMCLLKSIFWDKDDCVIQFHPPEKEYVSLHPYCLHLWRSTEQLMPIPETYPVGPDSAIKK